MILHALLVGAGAYLLGAIPNAVLIGRLWKIEDIRRHGSGNPGAANALKVLGPVGGAFVFGLDVAKGLAAAALPILLFHDANLGYLGGLMAIIGHIYPVYMGFRGGKGLAAGCGALLWLKPLLLAVYFMPLWALVYLWRRHVALASTIALLGTALAAVLLLPAWPAAVVVFGAAVIIRRHWPEARQALRRR